jgi:hypothetical protein
VCVAWAMTTLFLQSSEHFNISSVGRLVPVEVAARKSPKQHEPSCGLAVVLPGGHRIEVHPDFDRSTFERLVGIPERV